VSVGRARRRSLAALLLAVVAGCSIQANSGPRDIPGDQQRQLDPGGNAAGEAIGSSRVFLVATDGEERFLRSVLRAAAGSELVMGALLEGPNNDEIAAGLDTELPEGLTLNSIRQSGGTLTVDVSDELNGLTSSELRLAVGQIVFTASELPGVRAVQLRVDGEPRAWPDGRGELRTTALTTYDYPGLAESAQPAYPPIPSATS
jgi:spore germination protein GerM